MDGVAASCSLAALGRDRQGAWRREGQRRGGMGGSKISIGFPMEMICLLQPGGGNSTKIFGIFTPKIGEMIYFDEHIFQMGWFNHQLDNEFSIKKQLVM